MLVLTFYIASRGFILGRVSYLFYFVAYSYLIGRCFTFAIRCLARERLLSLERFV